MPTLEELLAPIEGERRGGVDVTYDPEYSEIATLREYHGENNPKPDYATIAELCATLLMERSKDLTVALWYTEARLRLDGFGGLDAGLRLVRGLLDGYWDSLFPEAAQDRSFALEFLGEGLTSRNDKFEPVKFVPLTGWGHALHHFEESRGLRKDAFKAADPKAKKKTDGAEEDPRAPTSENFETAFKETPKARYKELKKHLVGCNAALKELEGLTENRFKEAKVPKPTFVKLKEALDKVTVAVDVLLKKKLELEPDPPEAVAPVPSSAPGGAVESPAAVAPTGGLPPEPSDSADAHRRIAIVARFLRKTDATSPAPYLLLRALRWGELRRGGGLDVRLLDAPATDLRKQLKTLLLQGDWPNLLEAAEEVMAGPCGRGWLDLQRYVLTALDGMGERYRAAAEAVRQELALLLRDVPELVGKTLMDDTPTANAETLEWLRLNVAQGESRGVKAAAERAPDYDSERIMAEATYEKALEWVASGNPRRGVELLKMRADREQSARARFITESLAASILVDAGMAAVARPMLENLVERITKQNLEAWESGAVVAKPLGLLYRCLPANDKRRTQLYDQICRLDPVLAIMLGSETDGRAVRPAPIKPETANEPTPSPQNGPTVAPGQAGS
jgi:type VI secretion system protein ImpA